LLDYPCDDQSHIWCGHENSKADGISDLLFVAGRPMQVEIQGELKPFVHEQSEPVLTSERIESPGRGHHQQQPAAAAGFEGTRLVRLRLYPEKRLPVSRQHLPSERKLRDGAAPPQAADSDL
jgi:hypothetical protein